MKASVNASNELQKIAHQIIKKQALSSTEIDQFMQQFSEAASVIQNSENNHKKRKTQHQDSTTISLSNVDKSSIAQLGVAQNAMESNAKNLNIVPIQIFLDNAIKALENVSRQEIKTNALIKEFIDGKISEDEVVLETTKLNLAISMVTTIMQSAVQTFKEIQQIPV